MEHPAAPSGVTPGSLEPRTIMSRLLEDALAEVDADRCTLTSIDQSVMRVESTWQRDGSVPSFMGKEYPLEALQGQPLLQEALSTGRIVSGPGFAASGYNDEAAGEELRAMRRIAIVPLQDEDVIRAVLILSRTEDRPFKPEELRSLQRFGAMALLALRNARLLEEVEASQRRGLDVLTRISQHVALSDDRVSFFENMSETVAQLVDAERAAFWLLIGDELVAQPAHGFTGAQLAEMRVSVLDPSRFRMPLVLYHGQAMRFGAEEFPAGDPWRHLFDLLDVRDGLAVPWRTAREPIGVLIAYNARHGWTAQSEWMLRLAARSSALVWQGYEAERRLAALKAEEVDRLAEHAARIASLDEQKSEFLRLASHELRTPITVVRGYLSMLEEGALGDLPPEAERILPVMSSRTTQIGALVEQMLAASRAQDTGFVPELTEVSVTDLVHRVVEGLNGTAAGRRVVVHSTGDPCALADSEKTETIVGNLLTNALKYSPGGGDVEVSIGHQEGSVSVAVSDQGIGISAKDLESLFRPFGRVDSEETQAIQGTGLGLYLSRRLARLQGGEIEVRSTPGSGSTFTLLLPALIRR